MHCQTHGIPGARIAYKTCCLWRVLKLWSHGIRIAYKTIRLWRVLKLWSHGIRFADKTCCLWRVLKAWFHGIRIAYKTCRLWRVSGYNFEWFPVRKIVFAWKVSTLFFCFNNFFKFSKSFQVFSSFQENLMKQKNSFASENRETIFFQVGGELMMKLLGQKNSIMIWTVLLV